jgi:predicted HTH transcriptional regulator
VGADDQYRTSNSDDRARTTLCPQADRIECPPQDTEYMTKSDTNTENSSSPDPHLKEQDKGIIEAFAREDHQVLTNSEIAQHVSLSNRQVRRRLDKLADQGIIGKRVAGGVKLAWLEKDVKEPITVIPTPNLCPGPR